MMVKLHFLRQHKSWMYVVIGSGSIVAKDIPNNSVAVGNPCRVVREITEEDKEKCWDR